MKNGKASRVRLRRVLGIMGVVGLLAAAGVYKIRQMRDRSQDHAVTGNLRIIGVAADQYFLENGKTSVRTIELIGTQSHHYIKAIATVAHESYNDTVILGGGVTASGIGGTRTITYSN